jgi:hypothetical protein
LAASVSCSVGGGGGGLGGAGVELFLQDKTVIARRMNIERNWCLMVRQNTFKISFIQSVDVLRLTIQTDPLPDVLQIISWIFYKRRPRKS